MENHVFFPLFVIIAFNSLTTFAQVSGQLGDVFSQFNQYIPQVNPYSPLNLVGLQPPNGGDPCANPFLPQFQYHICSHNYKLSTNPLSYANARGLLRKRRGAAAYDTRGNPDPSANPPALLAPKANGAEVKGNHSASPSSTPSSVAIATPQRRRRRHLLHRIFP